MKKLVYKMIYDLANVHSQSVEILLIQENVSAYDINHARYYTGSQTQYQPSWRLECSRGSKHYYLSNFVIKYKITTNNSYREVIHNILITLRAFHSMLLRVE